MLPPVLYLETSVWGSLAPRQPRDRAQAVRQLLRMLDGVRGTCVISEVVLAEIDLAPAKESTQIRHYLEATGPTVHAISEAMTTLAFAYISAGVLPESRDADAAHVAAATCLEAEYLVSWNHRHMTRPMKRLQYESVNRLHGYLKTPLICNPFEACDELRNR
jgi:hypothetical protein